MKKTLSKKDIIYVASMLFGLFFGAGNLIFPVYMGSLAGKNVISASLGFMITGVGIPLLAITALARTHSEGLFHLSKKVSLKFGVFFTTLLYLTIGPFFAIPRCATVSFTVGVAPLLKDSSLYLLIFTALFFLAVLWFSLRSSKILVWVGKILNPLFLLFLVMLMLKAFTSPLGNAFTTMPIGNYVNASFMTGFFEGYNTMDALAGLAFGIIVVSVIRDLGISEDKDISNNTIISGIFSCLLMGVIYFALALIGANSTSAIGPCNNGGEVLYKVATIYFGNIGALLLAIMVTLACLKTAVGLISSCAETFTKLYTHSFSHKVWTCVFVGLSFLIANLGLNQIISISIPVLMFLYPLCCALIAVALLEGIHKGSSIVYKCTLFTTIPFAVLELVVTLPFNNSSIISTLSNVRNWILLGDLGLGWLIPAFIAFVVGLIISNYKQKHRI